jgi:hypothetical protein
MLVIDHARAGPVSQLVNLNRPIVSDLVLAYAGGKYDATRAARCNYMTPLVLGSRPSEYV